VAPSRSSEQGARGRVIEDHLPLVESVARRYIASGEPVEDLVQAGAIGLIKAVDRFEPSRGLALSTLAVPAIEGEIRHHLRDRAPLVRAPRPVRELDARLRAAEADLRSSGHDAPTTDELAAAVGAPPQAVMEALAARAAVRPAPLPDVQDGHDEQDDSDARVILARGWPALRPRERRVLELRFFEDLTQAQIARELKLSQAHVSRLIDSALQRLRQELGVEVAGATTRAYSEPAMASEARQSEERHTHSGRILVRMPRSLHAELAQAAEREGVSLNSLITTALSRAVADEGGDPKRSPPPGPSRWSSVALVANFAIVGLLVVVAIVLLVVALSS
jgi:RNA polymerase sigma-B factor